MRAGLGGGRLAMADQWHFNLAPYLWMTGIKGDVMASQHWTIGGGLARQDGDKA